MSNPKYLTGDAAAVNEFIDKFDVSDLHAARITSYLLMLSDRSFCSTAMVG